MVKVGGGSKVLFWTCLHVCFETPIIYSSEDVKESARYTSLKLRDNTQVGDTNLGMDGKQRNGWQMKPQD